MSSIDINEIKLNIEFLKGTSHLELIDKGHSGDLKYTFIKDQKRYLIRLNQMDDKDRQMPYLNKSEKLHLVVEYMQKVKDNHVTCPIVYDHGILPQYHVTYLITSYIDGDVAEVALKQMDHNEQYNVGYELGKDINKLHQINYKSPDINWLKQNLEPYHNKMAYYKECRETCKIKLDENIERDLSDYISKYSYLLKEQDIKLIHNDIHTGNIIIKNKKYAGIIDFNEIGYGDVIFDHKYLRVDDVIHFPAFCKGIVDGYFEKHVPELFWKITYLYNALGILTYLPLPNHYTDEIKLELDLNHKTYEAYSLLNAIPPIWYQEN